MRRTLVVILLAVSSLAAAAIAAIFRPAPAAPPVQRGALRITTQLDRRYLPETGAGEAYLQIDLTAGGDPAQTRRVPVNAVLVLDRSGSMRGPKIERARDAARALVAALSEQD